MRFACKREADGAAVPVWPAFHRRLRALPFSSAHFSRDCAHRGAEEECSPGLQPGTRLFGLKPGTTLRPPRPADSQSHTIIWKQADHCVRNAGVTQRVDAAGMHTVVRVFTQNALRRCPGLACLRAFGPPAQVHFKGACHALVTGDWSA